MKKKASIIMSLTIFILLALSLNQNNMDISADSQITTEDEENQINDLSNQKYIPRNSANYDPGAKYEWWSSNWTFRVPLAVNSTYINRTDFSIKIDVNFTEYLNNPELNGGELDVNSIRVVEYEEVSSGFAAMYISNDSYSDLRKYLVPSRYIPTKDEFNATVNATGIVWFEMPGFSESNANRTFMVYFDSIENGPKDIDEMNVLWNTKFNKNSDVVGDDQFHLAYGSVYRGLGLGGELTIWNSDLQDTMGNPSTKWGNVENYFVMAPGDFDGDGDVELVVSNINNYFTTIDYNQETGLWEEIWKVSYNFDLLSNTSTVRHFNLQAYDMDNDGKDEIIAPSFYNTLYPDALKIVIYGFDENHDLFIKNNLTTPEAYCNDVALADLNQDGYMDIIAGAINGPNDLWRNKSYYYLHDTSESSGYSRHMINYTYPAAASRHIPRYCYSTKAQDIDNDGKIEVLFSETDGRIYIWEWNGTDLEFKANLNTLVPGGLLGGIEDWDLDGRNEVVVGNYDGSIPTSMRVFEVTGDNLINVSTNEWANENLAYLRMTFPIFGDMDNSGDIEIAVGCYESSGDYDGRVTVWDADEEFTPEWQSPIEGRMVGAYYYYSESMLSVLGGYDTRMAPLDINYETYVPEIKPPDLTIQVFDVDKGPVPGLGVILDNGTESYSESFYTDSEGKVQFTDLSFVSYELNVSIENQMGNRSVFSGEILINNTRDSFVIDSSLWKISFIVEDKDDNRLNYGDVDLYNETQGDIVNSSENLAIDGTCSFYWFEKSTGSNEYNYSIDYFNSYYNPDTTRIYENSVTQQGLTSIEDFFNGSTTDQTDLGSDDYRHIVSYYARNSTENNPGDQIINWANIDISGGTGNIYQVEIYGVDQNNNQYLMNSFVDDYGDSFNLEYQLWNNSDPLVGLKLHIFVHNTTQHDGIINVTLQETFVERVKVDLFQRKIILWDQYDIPLENAIVHIYNNDTTSLVNLTTNQDGEAIDEDGNYFWYLAKNGSVIEGNYTMKIEFFNDFYYFIESTESGQNYDFKNFTLESFEEIAYNVELDSSKFSTEIEIISSNYMNPLNYRETLNVTVNITAYDETEDNKFSINPDVLGLSLKNSTTDYVYLNTTFKQIGTGIYECLINPFDDNIPVLNDNNIFTIMIFAETPGYGNNPESFYWTIEILPINTTISLYNGSTQIVDTLDVYLGIEFDITLLYEDLGQDLTGATAIIDWEYADNELMIEQSGGGFTNYTFLINTSEDVRLGTYILEFSVSLTNYTTTTTIIQLNVLEIPTTVQSSTTSLTSELLLINKNISETDIYLFNFTYFDVYHGENIAEAECFYSWNKIETGEFGSYIPMITSGDGTTYVLDFNTTNLTEGSYNIIVTLTKSNYQQRQVLIYLTVEKRVITYELGGSFEGSNSIVEVSGQKLEFAVELWDQTTGYILLDALVTITFDDEKEPIVLLDDDGDGIYNASKTYSKDVINAFFRDNNFQGTLVISADHYATIERDISITITMDEIFENFPTFYFLIVLGAVLILVGSLTGYKLYQQGQIPAFVKLINKLEKQISGDKEVLRNNLTLTMEEEIIKQFKDEWAILDYNIEDIWKNPEDAGDFKSPADNTGGS